MTNTFKTIAIAALLGTVSAPAFAAAHMSSSMTCAEFNALSAEDQLTVAVMAIAEIDDGANGTSMETDAKASDTTTTVTAEAATDATPTEGSISDGEPKAVEATGGNADASNETAEDEDVAALEQVTVICSQNLDAKVSEAAAGLEGTK